MEAKVDRAKLDATTEEGIRHHMIEDGEDPDEEPQFERPVLPQDVRKKLWRRVRIARTLVPPEPLQPCATALHWSWSRRERLHVLCGVQPVCRDAAEQAWQML